MAAGDDRKADAHHAAVLEAAGEVGEILGGAEGTVREPKSNWAPSKHKVGNSPGVGHAGFPILLLHRGQDGLLVRADAAGK